MKECPRIFLAQFPLLEEFLTAAGIVVWPMIEFKADDALASGAVAAARDKRVEQVVICTPDKDLGQCVEGTRYRGVERADASHPGRSRRHCEIWSWRRSRFQITWRWWATPRRISRVTKMGSQIVGSSTRKIPSHRVNPRYFRQLGVNVAGAATRAATLSDERPQALLFRTLATLRRAFLSSRKLMNCAGTVPNPEFDQCLSAWIQPQ